MPGDLTPSQLIVLGLIARHGPMTPYELKAKVESSVGMYWPVPHAQLYRDPARLAELGLLREEAEEHGRRRRVFHLTDAGVAEAAAEAPLPWQAHGESDDQIRNLRLAVTQLMGAAKQLSGAGENAQVERGIAVVQKARKELYQILAED